jgi:hypothetical protein
MTIRIWAKNNNLDATWVPLLPYAQIHNPVGHHLIPILGYYLIFTMYNMYINPGF